MTQPTPNCVMACINEHAHPIVDASAWVAQTLQAPLQLLHTVEHSHLLAHSDHTGNLTPNESEHLLHTLSADEQAEKIAALEKGKQILAEAQARLAHLPLENISSKQRHGTLVEALSDLEASIRILVLGTSAQDTHKVSDQLERVIRTLHRPILIINGHFTPPSSMMLAYNNTEGAKNALASVCQSPLFKNMHIHLVHASNQEAEALALIAQAEQQLAQAQLSYQTAWLKGDAQTELLNYQDQNQIDLTVMGASNHGKLHQLFFGSFTLKMLAHNQKPVLLLR